MKHKVASDTSKLKPEPASDIWRPRVTVASIIEQNGRFLFVEEWVKQQKVINQPAGHLDAGEQLIAAAARETLEETAWEVQITDLVAVYEWRSPVDNEQFLRFAFCGKALTHHPERKLDSEIIRALWLTPAELTSGEHQIRSPLVEKALHDYQAGLRIPLSSIQTIGALSK